MPETKYDVRSVDAVECLRVLREARSVHVEFDDERETEPGRRLDALVDAIEASGDPVAAVAHYVLASIFTAGLPEERQCLLDLLGALPTGARLLKSVAMIAQFDGDVRAKYLDIMRGVATR